MGSLISFGLSKLELDWGKNDSFNNHSCLFKSCDKKLATYYYADGIKERKPALVRPLKRVKPRLELLGYSLTGCANKFDQHMAAKPSYIDDIQISFAQFASLFREIDVDRVKPLKDSDYFDFGELVEAILADPEFDKLKRGLNIVDKGQYEVLEQLDPYILLRLLAENNRNLEKLVASCI